MDFKLIPNGRSQEKIQHESTPGKLIKMFNGGRRKNPGWTETKV